ncbi:MAG: sulfoxide reductase heme-binding subunit YedZ [Anaerolineales bacterium]|uniref:Protein-methionine-sulfoxide reductase heme-binding subunit MsrQ n=1 Tax=Candidatus Desulfolinea nitratireducens TaxID=2841698 RepID=A0A8J6NF73_9CHLR|nr:sulfoxide reductase heme-binding subunit YedZ [Candidatus Desulfolinea nitratireducens]MBL6962153.1 sulfoxide reductase heme-binding subunit YedZ [Anaerolineales bacterium]
MKKNTWKFTPLQIAAHVGALIPLLWMIWDIFTNNFGPDPIREFTLRTGKTALTLLLLSLACTPINILFKYKQVLKLRRPLGLYSFLYASIHFSIFIGVDYFFNFALIQDALLEKRYAIVGLTTGLILLTLAITSTLGWQRRLKKNWKKLHRLVYLAGALAVTHYIWLVKQGVIQPWIYAGILLILLTLRVKPVKKWAGSLLKGVRFSRAT